MKKILVLTDFSEKSENALNIASQISQKNSIELVLLHIIETEKLYTINDEGGYMSADDDENYKNHRSHHKITSNHK